jgi:hypothetical protein
MDADCGDRRAGRLEFGGLELDLHGQSFRIGEKQWAIRLERRSPGRRRPPPSWTG